MQSLLLTLAIIALVVWVVMLIMRVAAHWSVLGIAVLLLLLWLIF